MWRTIERATCDAMRAGCSRAEVVEAIRSGCLPTDRPEPHGPAMIIHRDLDEWIAGRTSR